MSVYTAIHHFCTRPTYKSHAIKGQFEAMGLLYDTLTEYVQAHLEQVWRSSGGLNNEAFLQYYSQQWKLFDQAANKTFYIFRWLNRHYVGCQSQEDKTVRQIHAQLLMLWTQSVSEHVAGQLRTALLSSIELQRNCTRISRIPPTTAATHPMPQNSNRVSIIKSALESCVIPDRLDESERDFDNLLHTFKDELFRQTTAYYKVETQGLAADSSSDTLAHWHKFLNRLSAEKQLMPDGPHQETILKPILRLTIETYSILRLEEYYHDSAEGGTPPPLLRVALKQHSDMVRLLTRNLQDLNLRDSFGRTALHSAVLGHNTALVESLLKDGARIGALDNDGYTAGHRAVQVGNLYALHLLLKKPDGCAVQNRDGRTIGQIMVDMNIEEPSLAWEEALEIAFTPEQTDRLFSAPVGDETYDNHDFRPTIVRYYEDSYLGQEQKRISMNILNDDAAYEEQMDGREKFKWVHLPANNVRV